MVLLTLLTVPMSLLLVRFSVKVSLWVALAWPVPSLAVTVMFRLPKLAGGLPLKVRVLALKFNQLGNGSPLARVAL